MRAAILAVGSELLGDDRLDTNSLRLARALATHGIELARKAVVGDDEAGIAEEIARLITAHELVLVTGGLGPTVDDRTREGAARALGRALRRVGELEESLEQRFAALGRRLPEGNRKQADLIEGAVALRNTRGTAPGQRLAAGSATLFLLPGVPDELDGFLQGEVGRWLAEHAEAARRETRTLRVAGLPESEVDGRLAPLYDAFPPEEITVLLASPGEVWVRLSARGSSGDRQQRLEEMVEAGRAVLGEAVFSEDEAEPLEAVVGRELVASGATLAIAESCTGGLVSERLTRIPGASAFLLGAVVAYANQWKESLLGVDPGLICRAGAVSEPVAQAMAERVRTLAGATYGLALTGIAGPAGGTPGKPVGTVHVALDGADPEPFAEHRLLRLPGDRERVRAQGALLALDLLRRRLVARRSS